MSYDITQYYESVPPKICLSLVPNPLPSYIEAYRVKGGLDAVQLLHIFTYADTRVGKPYDFLGVFSFGMVKLGGLEFCSQYTEDSFAQGNVMLSPDVQFTTPDDIASSTFLQRIPA